MVIEDESTEYRVPILAHQIRCVRGMLMFNTIVHMEEGTAPEDHPLTAVIKPMYEQIREFDPNDGELVLDDDGMFVFYMSARTLAHLINLPAGLDFVTFFAKQLQLETKESIKGNQDYFDRTSNEILSMLIDIFSDDDGFKEMKAYIDSEYFNTVTYPN